MGTSARNIKNGWLHPSGSALILRAVNLIIIHPNELCGDRVELSDERARHVRKVLKAEVGKALRVGLLNGPLGTGTVEAIHGNEVALTCVFETVVPPRPRIDLVLAMPRPKVLKRMWAQLAALGVGRIVLLRADKVERFYFDSHVVEPEFYERLLIEGLQQARCTRLPEVIIRPLFKPFVEDELEGMFAGERKLLADPAGEKRLSELFHEGAVAERVVLAVGPEGGWTPYEVAMLMDRGFEVFGAGERILRTDTATIALLALLSEHGA